MLLHFGSRPTLVVSSAEAASRVLKTHDAAFCSKPRWANFTSILYNGKGMVAARPGLMETIGGDEGFEINVEELMTEIVRLMGRFSVGDFVPWLAWIDRFPGDSAKVEKVIKILDGFLERVLEKHSIDHKGKPKGDYDKDFVEVLLELQKGGDHMAIHRESIKALLLCQTDPKKLSWMTRGCIFQLNCYLLENQSKMCKSTVTTWHQEPCYSLMSGNRAGPKALGRAREILGILDEIQIFGMIPFGSGRRGCPGESFAVANMELAMANLLLRFDWRLRFGVERESLEHPGITTRRRTPLLAVATSNVLRDRSFSMNNRYISTLMYTYIRLSI